MGDLSKEKIDAIRTQYCKRQNRAILSKQKIKPEYLDVYPWIQVDEQDPHFVFCRMCECRLTAKSSDFKKHERSIKHRENIALKVDSESINCPTLSHSLFDDKEFLAETELSIKQESIKMEQDNPELMTNSENGISSNDVYDDVYEDDESSLDSASASVPSKYIPKITLTTLSSMTKPSLNQPSSSANSLSSPNPVPCKITIKKVDVPANSLPNPMRVTSSSTAMMNPNGNNSFTLGTQQNYLNSLNSNSYNQNIPNTNQFNGNNVVRTLGNTSYDLFFQSICETVKSLPPRLALEGKLKIMQVVGELEEKALAQRESIQD